MPRRAAPAADPPAAAAGTLDPRRLFATLAGRRGLVLAVSGGADSTALMCLMARWAERPPFLVATVDHGLRPESAAEAQLVAENAAQLGLPSRILTAPERGESGNLQDWARRARYHCLAEAAREAGFDTIVTAHHRDDQAETFLLRLARGSGIYGLAAMPKEGTVDGITLARPLLGLSHAALVEIAAESGLAIVDDPSNANPRFDRVRMRGFMPELSSHGLTPERLAETADRLRRAAAAIDHYAVALLRDRFEADSFGVVRGDSAALTEAPEEIGLRALALLLRAVGGADYTPELHAVEALHTGIRDTLGGESLKRTLHGVILSATKNRLFARREWGRGVLADAAATPGATLVWDHRFRVEIPPLSGTLGVGPLGQSGLRLRSPLADHATVQTLPGLFQNGILVAVPQGIGPPDGLGSLQNLAVECLVARRLGIESALAPPG